MFEQMRSAQVHAIFLAGDIVHSKVQNITPELIDVLCWWFRELAQVAPLHVMLGNHDGLIYNPDRLDAISPIINQLKDPNIYLYRDSGVYEMALEGQPKVQWYVLSPFDEEQGAWEPVLERARIAQEREVTEGWGVGSPIRIGGFHGAVQAATTDENWSLHSTTTHTLFSPFHFTMLGDIHRFQTLDKGSHPMNPELGRVVYSGSMIQQNFGEDTDKGWVLWKINSPSDWSYEHRVVPNSAPYLTFQWEDSPEKTIKSGLGKLKKIPPTARVRVMIPRSVSAFEGNAVSSLLRAQGHRGTFKVQADSSPGLAELENRLKSRLVGEGEGTAINLYDISSYRTLYKKWLQGGGVIPTDCKEIDEAVDKASDFLRVILDEVKSESGDRVRSVKWSIERLEWDNVFSYGEGNVIDFAGAGFGTIYGVFGPNGVGKSTVVLALMYALFNSTDRGAMSNGSIVNDRCDWCEARVFLDVGGKKVRVKRRTSKNERRTRGTNDVKLTYETNLQLHQLVGSTWVDLSGEQRRDTDKILREMIGSADEFLAVSLSPQGGALEFVESGGAKKRDMLVRLMDLSIVDELSKRIKEHSAEDRAWTKRGKGSVEIANEIKSLEEQIVQARSASVKSAENKERARAELSNIKWAISKDQKERIEYLQGQVKMLERSRGSAKESVDRFEGHLQKYRERLAAISETIAGTKTSDLQRERAGLEEQIQTLDEISKKVDSLKREIAANNRLQKNLNGVPCGDSFPTCPYIRDAIVAKGANGALQREVDGIGEIASAEPLRARLKEINEILTDIGRAKIEQTTLNERLDETIADWKGAKATFEEAQKKLDEAKGALAELDEAVQAQESDKGLVVIYERLKEEIKNAEEAEIKAIGALSVLEHRLNESRKAQDDSRQIEERLSFWNSLLEFLSPKGVLNIIFTQQLPLVNELVNKALGSTTDYTVHIEMPEDSKSLEVYLCWGDKMRHISTGSGMQKLMAAIAIRSALHAITPLPKADLFVLDEGFGALDADNLEGCFAMLDLYRQTYRNILLISHIDIVKGAVDIPLTVSVSHDDLSNLKHSS